MADPELGNEGAWIFFFGEICIMGAGTIFFPKNPPFFTNLIFLSAGGSYVRASPCKRRCVKTQKWENFEVSSRKSKQHLLQIGT